MTSAFQTTVEASRRLFSWWREELAEMVPSPLRRWAAGEAKRTILTPENDRFVRYEEIRGRLLRRGEMNLPPGGPGRNRGRPAARGLSRSVGVRLPRSACLIRRLELPAAARQDFGKILQLDL